MDDNNCRIKTCRMGTRLRISFPSSLLVAIFLSLLFCKASLSQLEKKLPHRHQQKNERVSSSPLPNSTQEVDSGDSLPCNSSVWPCVEGEKGEEGRKGGEGGKREKGETGGKGEKGGKGGMGGKGEKGEKVKGESDKKVSGLGEKRSGGKVSDSEEVASERKKGRKVTSKNPTEADQDKKQGETRESSHSSPIVRGFKRGYVPVQPDMVGLEREGAQFYDEMLSESAQQGVLFWASVLHFEGEKGKNSGKKSDKSWGMNVTIMPAFLDWKRQPVCMPTATSFVIINNSNYTQLIVHSMSTNNMQFYPADFRETILPPNGQMVVSMLFLPGALGMAEGTLVLGTSVGKINLQMHGFGVPSPYNLVPLVGLRVLMGQQWVHQISLYNPFDTPLRVIEAQTHEAFLSLSLPEKLTQDHLSSNSQNDEESDEFGKSNEGGEEEKKALQGPASLWEVSPREVRPILNLEFLGPLMGRYVGVLRLRLRLPFLEDQNLMIPVDIGTVGPGLWRAPDELNFGTLVNPEQSSIREVSLFNGGIYPVMLEDVSDLASDPNLVEVKYERGLILQPGILTPAIELTYMGGHETPPPPPPPLFDPELATSAIWADAWWQERRVVVRTNCTKTPRIEIMYKSRVIHGSIAFIQEDSNIFLVPQNISWDQEGEGGISGNGGRRKEVKLLPAFVQKMALVNNFKTPLIIYSVACFNRRFEIFGFPDGILLSPGDSTPLFEVRLYLLETQIVYPLVSHLVVSSNLSEMALPLHVHSGKLHFSLSNEENKNEEKNTGLEEGFGDILDLDLGFVTVGHALQKTFNITNKAPKAIPIISVNSHLPDFTLLLESVWDSSGNLVGGGGGGGIGEVGGGGGEVSPQKSAEKLKKKSLLWEGPITVQLNKGMKVSKKARTGKGKISAEDSLVVYLQPGQTAIFSLKVVPMEVEVKKGVMEIKTPYETRIIAVQYESLTGAVALSPSPIVFPPTFPGRPLRKRLYATSTFSRPINLSNLISTDIRIIPELTVTELPPGVKTEIGSLVFDASRCPMEDNYMLGEYFATGTNTPQGNRGGGGGGGGGRQGKKWNNDSNCRGNGLERTCGWGPNVGEIEEQATKRREEIWLRLQFSGKTEIETSLALHTTLMSNWGVTVKTSLSRPLVIVDQKGLNFSRVQVGSSIMQPIRVANPSDGPIRMQLLVGPATEQNCTCREGRERRAWRDGSDGREGSEGIERREGRESGNPCASQETIPTLGFGGKWLVGFSSVKGDSPLFSLAEGGVSEVVVPAKGEAVLGPISFQPTRLCSVEGIIYVRNNFTRLESTPLIAEGGSGQLDFEDKESPENPLQLNVSASLLGLEKFNGNGEKIQIEGFPRDWPRPIVRNLNAVNRGNLPLLISSFSLTTGRGDCQGHGFSLSPCSSFSLLPGQSIPLQLSFKPDFSASQITEELRVTTSAGIETFQLVARLPHELLSLCVENSPSSAVDSLLRNFFLLLLTILLAMITNSLRRDFTVSPSPWFLGLPILPFPLRTTNFQVLNKKTSLSRSKTGEQKIEDFFSVLDQNEGALPGFSKTGESEAGAFRAPLIKSKSLEGISNTEKKLKGSPEVSVTSLKKTTSLVLEQQGSVNLVTSPLLTKNSVGNSTKTWEVSEERKNRGSGESRISKFSVPVGGGGGAGGGGGDTVNNKGAGESVKVGSPSNRRGSEKNNWEVVNDTSAGSLKGNSGIHVMRNELEVGLRVKLEGKNGEFGDISVTNDMVNHVSSPKKTVQKQRSHLPVTKDVSSSESEKKANFGTEDVFRPKMWTQGGEETVVTPKNGVVSEKEKRGRKKKQRHLALVEGGKGENSNSSGIRAKEEPSPPPSPASSADPSSPTLLPIRTRMANSVWEMGSSSSNSPTKTELSSSLSPTLTSKITLSSSTSSSPSPPANIGVRPSSSKPLGKLLVKQYQSTVASAGDKGGVGIEVGGVGGGISSAIQEPHSSTNGGTNLRSNVHPRNRDLTKDHVKVSAKENAKHGSKESSKENSKEGSKDGKEGTGSVGSVRGQILGFGKGGTVIPKTENSENSSNSTTVWKTISRQGGNSTEDSNIETVSPRVVNNNKGSSSIISGVSEISGFQRKADNSLTETKELEVPIMISSGSIGKKVGGEVAPKGGQINSSTLNLPISVSKRPMSSFLSPGASPLGSPTNRSVLNPLSTPYKPSMISPLASPQGSPFLHSEIAPNSSSISNFPAPDSSVSASVPVPVSVPISVPISIPVSAPVSAPISVPVSIPISFPGRIIGPPPVTTVTGIGNSSNLQNLEDLNLRSLEDSCLHKPPSFMDMREDLVLERPVGESQIGKRWRVPPMPAPGGGNLSNPARDLRSGNSKKSSNLGLGGFDTLGSIGKRSLEAEGALGGLVYDIWGNHFTEIGPNGTNGANGPNGGNGVNGENISGSPNPPLNSQVNRTVLSNIGFSPSSSSSSLISSSTGGGGGPSSVISPPQQPPSPTSSPFSSNFAGFSIFSQAPPVLPSPLPPSEWNSSPPPLLMDLSSSDRVEIVGSINSPSFVFPSTEDSFFGLEKDLGEGICLEDEGTSTFGSLTNLRSLGGDVSPNSRMSTSQTLPSFWSQDIPPESFLVSSESQPSFLQISQMDTNIGRTSDQDLS